MMTGMANIKKQIRKKYRLVLVAKTTRMMIFFGFARGSSTNLPWICH